jgi:hypothetical protein
MKLYGSIVLLVGQHLHRASALADRLHRWGFQSHFARDMRAASDVLNARPVNLVLRNTYLSDGSSFALLLELVGLPISAFLCFTVEKGCFWLPAIDGGMRCLGLPALTPSEFASALKQKAQGLAVGPRHSKPAASAEVA